MYFNKYTYMQTYNTHIQYTHTCTYMYFNKYTYMQTYNTHIQYTHTSVFDKLIWCTIGPKSFLFGTAQFSLWPSAAVNYDYIVTNSINWLKMYSQWCTH